MSKRYTMLCLLLLISGCAPPAPVTVIEPVPMRIEKPPVTKDTSQLQKPEDSSELEFNKPDEYHRNSTNDGFKIEK